MHRDLRNQRDIKIMTKNSQNQPYRNFKKDRDQHAVQTYAESSYIDSKSTK